MLAALGRNYLLREPNPKPLTWREAALRLAELQPGAGWTAKKLEHRVGLVRDRLSRRGVHGLTREEVGEPVGNALNDNLLRELVRSTALEPKDLDLLDQVSGSSRGGRPSSPAAGLPVMRRGPVPPLVKGAAPARMGRTSASGGQRCRVSTPGR